MRLLRRALTSVAPAVLAGVFVALPVVAVSQLAETGRLTPDGFALGLVLGAVFGLATLGLIRLFPVARWAWPVCGLLAGPMPFLLVAWLQGGVESSDGAGGGIWALGAFLGAVIGLLEWARVSRDGRGSGDA